MNPKEPEIQAWQRATPAGAINPGYRPPMLDMVDVCTLQGRAVPERGWLVQGWVPLRQVVLFGGDAGLGKSTMAMQLLSAAASGGDWIGLPVARMKCLYFSCEDEADEMHRRQTDINRAVGIDFADLDHLLWADRTAEDNIMFAPAIGERGFRGPCEATDVYRSVMRACIDGGIQLVVLDSLHDVFGGNENSRSEVRRFMGLLRTLAVEIDGVVVVLQHPSLSGRASGTGESGSTAWNAACRSRLYLSKPDDDDTDANARILARKKANYAGLGDGVKLQWRDGVFWNDAPDIGFVGALDRAGQARRVQEVFLDLLERREKEGRPVSHKSRSGTFAPAEFAKHRDRQGYRKADFVKAMETLFAEGAIEVVAYGDRKSRMFEKIAPVAVISDHV